MLADGRTPRFYVNDLAVIALSDTLWTEGEAGVIAAATDGPGVEIAFDNWRLWSLPEE